MVTLIPVLGLLWRIESKLSLCTTLAPSPAPFLFPVTFFGNESETSLSVLYKMPAMFVFSSFIPPPFCSLTPLGPLLHPDPCYSVPSLLSLCLSFLQSPRFHLGFLMDRKRFEA